MLPILILLFYSPHINCITNNNSFISLDNASYIFFIKNCLRRKKKKNCLRSDISKMVA